MSTHPLQLFQAKTFNLKKGKIYPEQFRKYSTLLDHPREVAIGLNTVPILTEVSNG